MPKVSVIIPVYNAEKYVRQCLDSVLQQTLRDIEVICVDDGSTDGSLNILKEYSVKDSRIKVLQQKNLHAGVARNRGMETASGEWIAFIDSDDFIEKDGLKKLYTISVKHSLDFIKCSSRCYDENIHTYGHNDFYENRIADPIKNRILCFEDNPEICIRICDTPWSGLYRSSFLKEHHISFPDFYCSNDRSFFIHCLLLAKRIMITDIYLTHHRVERKNSLVNTKHYHFDDQISTYLEIKTIARIVADGKFSLICLQVELQKLFYWYKRLLKRKVNQQEINEQMLCFVANYDENDVGKDFLRQFSHAKMYSFLRRRGLARKASKRVVLIDNRNPDTAPSVSVIVSIYNTAPWLRECMESLIGQTLQNIELICVNDGSTDGSLDILKDYASNDSRIVVISQENSGQAAARNAGVCHARGQYICFCDSDDYVKENALQVVYDLCQKDDLDMAFFNAGVIFESESLKQKLSDKISRNTRTHSYKGIWSGKALYEQMLKNKEYLTDPCISFIKKQFFLNNELWFVSGITYEDDIYMLKCMYHADKTAYIPDTLYCRRYREESTVTQRITFWNAYSRFVCITELLETIHSGKITSDDNELLKNCIKAWKKQVIKIYHSLPREEKNMVFVLPLYEQLQFDLLVANSGYSQLLEENKRNKKLLNDIRHGYSFRIGRVITFVPRKVRGGIRCYKEHGLRYTAKRVLFHLKWF